MPVDGNPASILSTRWLTACLRHARPYSHGRLLDVGCGRRPYERLFAHTGYVGLDWRRLPGLSAPDVLADVKELPFPANTFDTVVCTEVIEHVTDPRQLVAEIVRVLAPGGHLILSAPFVHPLHEEPFDFFRFTHLGLRYLLNEAGLQVVARWERGGVVSVLVSLWSRFVLALIGPGVLRAPAPVRPFVRRSTITVLVDWPQRIAAYCLIDRRGALMSRFDTAVALSLGSVVVARLEARGPAGDA